MLLFSFLFLFCSVPFFVSSEIQENQPQQIRLTLTNDPATEQMISWVVKTKTEFHRSVLLYTQKTNRVSWTTESGSSVLDRYAKNCSEPSVWSRRDEESGNYFLTYVCLLTNLHPDTSYSYSIIGDTRTPAETTSKTYTFITQPVRLIPQMIGIIADMGTWPPVDNLMPWISEFRDFDLFLHIGDMSYGLEEKIWDTWGNLVQDVAARVPYQTIPGNWDAKGPVVKSYKHRFLGPLLVDKSLETLNYYYSFKFSYGTFVMLSAYDDYTPQSEQYKWLEATLHRAQSDRLERPWIIVGIHNPMYSSSQGHDGGDEKVRNALEKLLYDHRVDLVLTGHDHGYERSFPTYDSKPLSSSINIYQDPSAPIHILAGVGGGTLDEWMPQPLWSAVREKSHGVVKLLLEYNRLTVEFTGWPSNKILDHFQIQKDAQFIRKSSRSFNSSEVGETQVLSPFSLFILCLIVFGFVVAVVTTRRRPYTPSFPV